jgi:hypothetical protein
MPKDELGLRINDLAGCLKRADEIAASIGGWMVANRDDLDMSERYSHAYNLGRIKRDLAGALDAVRLMEENHDA